ncbi:MAG: succinate dehydrogenase [Pirellulales bacterium]
MHTTSAPPAPAEARPSFVVRHQFVIYRLFSLAGLVPVGAYLVVHLLTNATIINGPVAFQDAVNRIHSLGPVGVAIAEWTFIFIPLLFHAGVGWLIIAGAVPNASSYPYASNVRYVMQRVTAILAFAFIMFHVIQLHHLAGAPFGAIGGAQFDPEHATSSAATAIRPLWITVLYSIGMLGTVYHFSNGVWTLGITWGIWTTAAAQRRASWISAILGLGLASVGMAAILGMSRVDIPEARAIEDNMLRQQEAIETVDGQQVDGTQSADPPADGAQAEPAARSE